MLIKEYRIPLPLTVEEYRIAQLYMIQKKSREESEGSDSAVEFIKNEPYVDGPNGSGQYTEKIYHIDRHLPGWLRSLAPKTALEVHEESWNAYPYTKTRFSVPFVEKFELNLETLFLPNSGHQENVFDLKGAELNQREIVVMDMVTEQLTGNDYKEEEDPRLFRSQKTGRGPLMADWRTNPPDGVIMCAYKLIKIEFRYWGLQSKVERLIDHALHRIMLRAHKQAWAWQDEWVGLTMDDIRELERDTQRILQEKLNHVPAPLSPAHPEGVPTPPSPAHPEGVLTHPSPAHPDSVPLDAGNFATGEGPSVVLPQGQREKTAGQSSQNHANGEHLLESRRPSKMKRKASQLSRRRSQVDGDQASDVRSKDSDTESMYSTQMEFALGSIALSSDSDSDIEFFDAIETIPAREDTAEGVVWHDAEEDGDQDRSAAEDSPSTREGAPSPAVDFLFLVVDSGLYLDEQDDKDAKAVDYQTIVDTLNSTTHLHFHTAKNRIAYRRVPCPDFSSRTLKVLRGLDPQSLGPEGPVLSHYCMAVLPLLVAESPEYLSALGTLTSTANEVYQKFISSEEGRDFSGQVCILANYLGSVAVYDILTGLGSIPASGRVPSTSSSLSSLSSPSTSVHSLKGASQHKSQPVLCVQLSTQPKPPTTLEETADHTGSGVDSFQFRVSNFFAFGSPLGLVLASRMKQQRNSSQLCHPQAPCCSGFYNIFYAVDPLASRIEPLLDERFRHVDPMAIPPYKQFPKGVLSMSLNETIDQYPLLRASNDGAASTECLQAPTTATIPSWWSDHRIDHVLESPQGVEGFRSFSIAMFSQVVNSRYWEAQEMASFILRQMLHNDLSMASSSHFIPPFIPAERAGPWNRRRTTVKVKKLSSNHRASDVVYTEATSQAILAVRFQYGPLDVVALTKEQVDIYILPPSNRLQWQLLGSASTDRTGRLNYSIPGDKMSDKGLYPLKFLVKGDHTTADCNMFVLPAQSEAVLFSYDGALASHFSIGAKGTQIHPGAVDVARYWQELGYFLIYASRRPDTQKDDMVACLGANGFPLGMVVCSEGITSNDNGSLRTQLLRLVKEAKISIYAAYGSPRHVSLYQELGVQPALTFIHSKKSKQTASKKQEDYQCLRDGFTTHVAHLRCSQHKRPATDISRVMGDLRFGLPGKSEGKSKASGTSHQQH